MSANHRQLLAEAQRLLRRGEWNAAETLCREVLARRPHDIDALQGLGLICTQTKRHQEAADCFRQVLALKPYALDALGNLGAALAASDRHEEATAAFRQFLVFQPDHALTYYNLGISYKNLRRLDEAITAYRRAIALKPDYPDAWCNLGNALRGQQKPQEAIAAFEEALRLNPSHLGACTALGHTLKDQAAYDRAVECFRKSMQLRPDVVEGSASLGAAMRDLGQTEEAIPLIRAAVARDSANPLLHGALLYTLESAGDQNPQIIFDEHRAWGIRHGRAPIAPAATARDPAPHRRLKIGYVSPDFRRHSVAYFLEGLLASHDPAAVDVFCYADVPHPDDHTKRFESYAPHWRNVFAMSNESFADQVRQDQIDILIDLAGHTTTQRLLAFAFKPAPIQVTWLGYPDTTGLDQIDYRLTDAYADPPGMTDAFNTETLFRLPRTFLCYTPPLDAPPAHPRIATTPRPFTFGSFNTLMKISPQLLEMWAALLNRVPHSRLFLKGRGLSSATAVSRLLRFFAAKAISRDRIELRDLTTSLPEHLDLYNRIDIALDAFPYHGTTTTCEALWMGVPVISLAGSRHVSRVGVSILNNVGLPELLAASPEEYVEKAATLAEDSTRLAGLHEDMRVRMRQSPLMNAPQFARDMEAAYRDMWRRWVATQAA